jgi:hypothetical protein
MVRPRTVNLDPETPPNRPTPEMIEEALRRNAAPRPATAWLMGDPPPGRSALDKKSRAKP